MIGNKCELSATLHKPDEQYTAHIVSTLWKYCKCHYTSSKATAYNSGLAIKVMDEYKVVSYRLKHMVRDAKRS